MATFALRVEKLKTAKGHRSVDGSIKHAYREIPTENATSEPKRSNIPFPASRTAGMARENFQRILGEIPKAPRSNAVQGIEFVVQVGKDHNLTDHQVDDFMQAAAGYLVNKYGGQKNVVYGMIHYDEQKPHLSLLMVPRTEDNRLSAREVLGNARQELSRLQTDFHKEVGSFYGLERPKEKSRAKHTTTKEFQTLVANSERLIQKEFGVKMDDAEFARRLPDLIKSARVGDQLRKAGWDMIDEAQQKEILEKIRTQKKAREQGQQGKGMGM